MKHCAKTTSRWSSGGSIEGPLFAAATIAIVAPYAHAAVEDDLRDGDKYFEDGDWKKAAAAYDRAIDKAPGQVAAEAYGKRAAIFIILKDYKGGLDFIAAREGALSRTRPRSRSKKR